MIAHRHDELPTRDLPPAHVRKGRVKIAQRAGVLTPEEASHMRDCISYGIDEFDVYLEDGQWIVWTHDGPKGIAWWKAIYSEACHRDRGRR